MFKIDPVIGQNQSRVSWLLSRNQTFERATIEMIKELSWHPGINSIKIEKQVRQCLQSILKLNLERRISLNHNNLLK